MKNWVIIFCLLFCQFCLNGQNWQSLGTHINWGVNNLYGDTINHRLIAVGPFNTIDTVSCPGIAVWNDTVWQPFLASTGNQPRSIVLFQGSYYVTGTASGGVSKWTGSSWSEVGHVYGSGYAYFLFNDGDSALYALGGFDSITGARASKIARYNGINWSSIGDTTWSGSVECAIRYNNKLYIGGGFYNSDFSIENMAFWDGAAWHPVGSGIHGGVQWVNNFAEYHGKLYAGGYFTTSNNNPGNYIASWNDTAWFQVGGGMTLGQVMDLRVFNDELWVSGQFSSAGGIPAPYVAKWNDTDWCNVGTFDNAITSLETFEGNLYAGGGVWTIDGDSVSKIVKWVGGNNTGACGHLNTGIQETDHSFSVRVFPNPATTSVTFEFNRNGNSQMFEMVIYDQLGREIWREKGYENRLELSTEEFEPGMYFYCLEENGEVMASGKLIIE